MTTVLEVKNIKKTFGQTEILKGVSFSINPGEIFGFLGRNGAGKSTLINILTGVIHQTSGEYSFFGHSLSEVKDNIGVFPDIDTFYNEWTPVQHLKFFSELQNKKVTQKEIDEKLVLVGLLNDKRKKVKNFSFGMKKKLGVAQALIGNPKFIILDEPTSGLDPESAINMRELLNKIAKQGTAIFITSHNLDELEKISHRIAILKNGSISLIGTMETLRAKSRENYKVLITLNRELQKEDFSVIPFPLITKGEKLQISVQHKRDVGYCIHELVHAGYEIYDIEHFEKTLEDIFLQNEEMK